MKMYRTYFKENNSNISHVKKCESTWPGPANTHDGMALDARQMPSTFNCLQCCVAKSLFLADWQITQAVVCPAGLNMFCVHENIYCQGF